MIVSELKVGDWVRITGNDGSITYTFDVGVVGDVNSVNHKEEDCMVYSDNGKRQYVNFQDLELISKGGDAMDFEVGDRVRVVANALDIGESVGDEGVIVDVDTASAFDWEVESDDFSCSYGVFDSCDLELISKGGDNAMQDVDAIAVEVDDEDLLSVILDKAEENDYVYGGMNREDFLKTIPDSENYLLVQPKKFPDKALNYDSKAEEFVDITLNANGDWNKVVEFLEQELQSAPTLNGYEADLDSEAWDGSVKVSVGCWNGKLKELKDFRSQCDNIGVAGGTVTVSGEQIDIQELFDFIEDVKEAI